MYQRNSLRVRLAKIISKPLNEVCEQSFSSHISPEKGNVIQFVVIQSSTDEPSRSWLSDLILDEYNDSLLKENPGIIMKVALRRKIRVNRREITFILSTFSFQLSQLFLIRTGLKLILSVLSIYNTQPLIPDS